MNKKSFLLLMLFTLCSAFTAVAQIGYQVALLNTATGKPRSGETVNATVTLTNKESTVIYTGTQKATTNDFGILSLTIGDADTFKNVDWNKLPLYISVSVDGVLIGKSQVLSVPVAETAKSLAPAFDLNDLLGTWEWSYTGLSSEVVTQRHVFNEDKSYSYVKIVDGKIRDNDSGKYDIIGNLIVVQYYVPRVDGDGLYEHMKICFFKDHKIIGWGELFHK